MSDSTVLALRAMACGCAIAFVVTGALLVRLMMEPIRPIPREPARSIEIWSRDGRLLWGGPITGGVIVVDVGRQ